MTTSKATPSDNPAAIFETLRRVVQRSEEVFRLRAGREHLTLRQFTVLKAVAQREGLSQTEIGEQTGIDRSTLSDTVGRLVRDGLLQRQRSNHDAREYEVQLSVSGRQLYAETAALAVTAEAAFFAVLGKEEMEALVRALHRLTERTGHAPTRWPDGACDAPGL